MLQGEQQGDHLDGLAQPHVVGQASAETELGQEMQPGQTAVLIRSQLGPQLRRAGDLPRARATAAGPASLRAGPAVRPVHARVVSERVAATSRSSAAPASMRIPSKKESPFVRTSASHRLPVLERLGQLLPVNLHPLALEPDQSVHRGQQFLKLGLAQGLAVQADADREIEQCVHAQRRAPPPVDPHIDDRPRRMTGLPPIRNANDQATFLKDRDVLQKAVRLPRRPRQRVIHVAGIDQFLHQSVLRSAALCSGTSSARSACRFLVPAYCCSDRPRASCCTRPWADKRLA